MPQSLPPACERKHLAVSSTLVREDRALLSPCGDIVVHPDRVPRLGLHRRGVGRLGRCAIAHQVKDGSERLLLARSRTHSWRARDTMVRSTKQPLSYSPPLSTFAATEDLAALLFGCRSDRVREVLRRRPASINGPISVLSFSGLPILTLLVGHLEAARSGQFLADRPRWAMMPARRWCSRWPAVPTAAEDDGPRGHVQIGMRP